VEKKQIILIGVIVACLGVAGYITFGRGGNDVSQRSGSSQGVVRKERKAPPRERATDKRREAGRSRAEPERKVVKRKRQEQESRKVQRKRRSERGKKKTKKKKIVPAA
jgi:hypothetical protein